MKRAASVLAAALLSAVAASAGAEPGPALRPELLLSSDSDGNQSQRYALGWDVRREDIEHWWGFKAERARYSGPGWSDVQERLSWRAAGSHGKWFWQGEAGSFTLAIVLFIFVALLAAVLGLTLVNPIGGADMPVVISLLNSYSGVAAGLTGFVIANNVLIISGALVGAAGLILTQIMCKAMNRSLTNVLFGVMDTSTAAKAGDVYAGVRSTTPEGEPPPWPCSSTPRPSRSCATAPSWPARASPGAGARWS